MQNKSPNKNWWIWALVVGFIVVVIVIYVFSFGAVEVGKENNFPPEFKDSKDDALERHATLKKILDEKKSLKRKLDRRFKMAFAAARVVLISLWIGLIYIFYYFNFIHDLSDALNYSEASLLTIAALNFVTFGNLTNLDNFLTVIRTRVENWVWRKNINLNADIARVEKEVVASQM